MTDSILFSPFNLGSLQLKNRIIVPPMCQYSAIDGCMQPWHLMHLGSLAVSGAALVFIEATGVEQAGRISPTDVGLWDDVTQDAIARTLRDIRSFSDTPFAIQLAHAGRKASCRQPWFGGGQLPLEDGGWQTYAPSPVPFDPKDRAPQELDQAGLTRIIEAFVQAARRSVDLGIDAIELHGAHGYLLHEFLSPLSNQRQDNYGGSLENRMRFALEVFQAVYEEVAGKVPVGVRISASDWVDGGWDVQQSIHLSQALKERGAAFIHVSSGGLSQAQQIKNEPGYQLPFAQAIKHAVDVPVIGVGLITDPQMAESVVASGQADLVGVARGMLYDARWPWHAAAELGAQIDASPQFWRSQPSRLKTLFTNNIS